MRRRTRALLAAPAALALLLVSSPALAAPGDPVDLAAEVANYAKTNERAAIHLTPDYQARLRAQSALNQAQALAITASDPERVFLTDLCGNGMDGCAGDVRLYDWAANGYGVVEPVLFTARSGATLSGHVWATREGPATRPGVVISNGSVQAVESFYWYAAHTLAKAGYVVLTYDPQGQGQSDTPGAGVDAAEGVPAQSDGRPYFDGTQDAVDFFFSTPSETFVPRPSCSSGTSHADKQDRRVGEGFDDGFNPYWAMLDPARVGVAGHSYGAAAVSYVGQHDPRIKAIVAWDNLAIPDPARVQGCVDPAERQVPPITRPALGISADYYLPPTPDTAEPDPLDKSEVSRAYTAAGVDSGELIIRGGTHYDFDWIPDAGFGATLRGADLIAWYTTAWMDKYVKGDPAADARLLTDRWRADAAGAGVDPGGDGNLFSTKYLSRLAVTHSGGQPFVCEDVRTGCAGLAAADGFAGEFDYLTYVTTVEADSPVVPEAPSAVLLPLAALLAGGAGLAVRRRRSAPA